GVVEVEQLAQVDVGNAVAPGEHEGLVAQMLSEALDTAAGRRSQPGVDQLYTPVEGLVAVVVDDFSLLQVDREAAVEGAVVDEVLLDEFALVAERDDEILVAE